MTQYRQQYNPNINYGFNGSNVPNSFGIPDVPNTNPAMDFSSIATFGQGQQAVDPNQFKNLNLGMGSVVNYGAPNTLGAGAASPTGGAPAAVGMDKWGKAGVGIDALGAIMQGYIGFQQLGMAKDQFNFQKKAYEQNYAMNVKTTNTAMEDRQADRVAGQGVANAGKPGAYASVDAYMAKNAVG